MEELDWQSRETAPKTGEQLLVKYDYDITYRTPDYSIVRWDGLGFVWVCDGESCKSSEDYFEPFFTHWYPLEKQKAHPQSRG